jgi:transcriptional regulator with XRE-family HTH domain
MPYNKKLWTADPDKFMRSHFMRRLARALRMRRESLGLSQEELALRAGLHRSYLSDVECGSRNITLGTLCVLSAALEILPSQLIVKTETATTMRRKGKKRYLL